MPKWLRRTLRSLIYILTTALVITLVALAAYAVFYSSEHTVHVNTLVKEAMNARTEYILSGVNPRTEETVKQALTKYFTSQCIAADRGMVAQKAVYDQFNISVYNYKTDVPLMVIYPWDNEIEIIIQDKMINLRGGLREMGEDGKDENPPEWNHAEHRLLIRRTGSFWDLGSKWSIVEFTKERSLQVEPLPTPPSGWTPQPATPTPSERPTPALPSGGAQR
ncbi:MAG: hypothetical protein ACOYJC_10610 [Christensenellales bacterium]